MECVCKPEIIEKVEDADKALFGNGHEGLIVRMARIETTTKILLGLVSANLVGIVGLIIAKIGG